MRGKCRGNAAECRNLVFLLFFFVWGCSPLETPDTAGRQRTFEQLEVPSEVPLLQVLITYNGPLSTHAALRLEHDGRSALFWDPAGLYGEAEPYEPDPPVNPRRRNNDVIWEHAPTLPAYWKFVETTGDTAMEVLEWRLSKSEAHRLYSTLVAGAQPGGFNGFATATAEPLCSIAVSHFLLRYGRGTVRVTDTHLFPADLAEELRTQQPDRVLVFATGTTPVEYLTVDAR